MSPTRARRLKRAGLAVLALVVASASSTPAIAVAGGAGPLSAAPVRRACPLRSGGAACLVLVRTDVRPRFGLASQDKPDGLGALDIRDAYRLPTAEAGKGQTVAIIGAFDDPKAEADLGVYRDQYGLPPCTTANGCLRKVNATGGTTLPPPNADWAEEVSLDLDMVSAACPNCHILIVEADEVAIGKLGTGVDTAVRLGAKYVTNSYGGAEADVTPADRRHFDHPGIAITAASGDTGYGVLFPATSPHVTAVGGTSLTRAANARGWNETAWSGAGSGCAVSAAKPAWQQDPGCDRRTVSDVSAVADPLTGLAVYDSYRFGGWQVVGGTSASAPIIAGAFALAGRPPAARYASAIPYAHPGALHDIVSGSTGTCDPVYLCTAGPGYDGPTGLGTPEGVAAFAAPRPVKDAGDRAAPHRESRPPAGTPLRRRYATAAPTPPAAGELAGGGFEDGLAGWTSSGVRTGVTKDHPHTGRYAALLGYPDDPAKGDSSISRRFVAARGHRRLSFWYNVSCPDREQYDWATAALRDDTAGHTHVVLPRVCTYDDTWRQVTAPVVGGHAYTLTLSSHDDGYFGDPTSTKYDDVTLS